MEARVSARSPQAWDFGTIDCIFRLNLGGGSIEASGFSSEHEGRTLNLIVGSVQVPTVRYPNVQDNLMISIALLLFLIMDPFGNLVVLNALLAEFPPRKRRLIILREAAIATSILLLAGFIGGSLLSILGLEEHSLRLAGGIVLFLIALGMLFPTRRMLEEPSLEVPPLIVPIAMPLIAGPSAISMVILFSEKHPAATVATAVLIAATASTVLLVASSTIFSFLGRRGATALERLMGMLLIMLSVQMILDGINAYIDSRG